MEVDPVSMATLSQAKACVAFLYGALPPGDDEPEPIGTCFFGGVGDQGDPDFFYLVTARHVYESLENAGHAWVRVNKPGGGTSTIPIILERSAWLFHEDNSVDLAVLPWTQARWQGLPVELHYWPLDWVFIYDAEWLREGEEAVFVGLMRPFPGKQRNLTMLRRGMFGLLPDEPILGRYGLSDYYVLDAQSYKGNSGAPVFNAEGSFFLVGVLTYAFGDEAEKVVIEGTSSSYYNLGVSLVTPVRKVEEIIQKHLASRKKTIAGD